MPANPRDLYNTLKQQGEISVSYADFRKSWDEPGWSVDFHKALRAKKMTTMSYNDFIATFSDPDPKWDAEQGIEISDDEIEQGEFEGKGRANDQDPENLAANFTGFPTADGELVSSDGKAYITKTDEEVAQELEIKLQKEKVRSFQKTEALNALYGNDLDARIAETASIKVDKGFEDYVAGLAEGIPEQEEDRTADALMKVMGSMGNIPIQMEAAWEGTKALIVASVNESDGGGGLADVMTGEASFFDTYELMDPVTKELVSFSSDRRRYQELQRLNRGADKPIQVYRNGKPVQLGKLADQFVGDKLKEIKKLNEGTFETGSITQGFKEGDAVEVATGVFNAVSSLAATMIPAAMTAGTSLAPQVVTPMWVDYNTTKAMTKYADSDDPIAAMIEADDTEFAVPLSLGAGALAFEAVGFKGISKYIAGSSKLGGSFMGVAKNQLGWMLTANKEGGTEWIQGGLETMNSSLAEGKSMSASVKLAAKNMFSQDGLEDYLQGAFGSGVSTAPSAAKRYVQRALRSDPAGHKAIVEGINDIAKLKEARIRAVKTKNKVEVKLLDADIKAVENRIKRVVQENNTIFNHLTDAENKQLRGIAKEMDAIAADAAEVDAAVTRGDITKMEGYQTKRKLQARHTVLSNEIAALKENVNLSKLRSDVAMAQKFAKNLPNLKLQTFTDKTQVRKAIDGALNEKGEPYTKKELDAFAKESAGLFWTDAQGIEHIVINETKSAKNSLTTTGQHEFLHKVLSKILKANPGLAVKMGGAVKKLIAELGEKGQISGKKNPLTKKLVLNERMSAYADKPKAERAEELITVLSEALTNGDVRITEENRSTFGGIKELVRRAFLDMGITSVKLDGDNVMQFIKDYNREFERGKLSKATRNLMEGKRTGKAIRKAMKAPMTPKGKQAPGKKGGIKQSLDSNEASFTWEEDVTGSFTTMPEQIGENTIALTIETGGNKALIESNPELGLDPNKKVYTISFEDQNTEFDMTNSGESLMVFGTVINNMAPKLDEIGAEQIIFSATPEANRQRLYTLMGATMAKKLGFNFESKVLSERASYIPKGDKVYALTRPKGGIKQSKVTDGDLYERTNKLYNEYKDDKQTAGFLIGFEWENQIKKLARKYKNLPGYDVNIEDVVAYVMTANQGVVGLVNSYKPGKKTKDGKNEVSLEGYINKYLPNYINTALGKHGIGEAKDEGGFAADITEVKNVTSSDTAEDSLILNDRQDSEIEEETRRPQLKDVVDLESEPELKASIEDKVVKNISASIKLFGKAKTRNEKIDAFIKETRKGIKNDEKAAGEFLQFIIDTGVDNFLLDYKNAFFENIQRNDLQRNPLFKRTVQQRFKGKWKSREPYANPIDGKTTYEYLQDDGTPYPPRHPDMDRDKMKETGTTAGHYKFRKVSNFDQVISNNEFVDFFYKDGASRTKLNKVKLQAFASQFSSEIGLELFAEQLMEGKGPIFEVLQKRVELTEKMTPEQIKEANEQKLIIRDGMTSILTEKGIQETLKDLERGGIKQSKVNKTGFSWFDDPRISMTNYLTGLENNEIRTGVVDGSIKSPEYKTLFNEMKDAYDMYVSMQEYKDDWAASIQNYAEAFADKNFANFDAFVDSTLNQVNNSIDGILGTTKTETSLGVKNEANKEIARKEGVERFVNDTLDKLPAKSKPAAMARLIKTLVGAVSGSKYSALYENTPGFYRGLVMPMLTKHKISAVDFDLVEVEGGTTITYKGKKITSDYTRGVFSEDTFSMFDALADGPSTLKNNVNVKARIKEAQEAKELFMEYVEYLRENYNKMSPNSLAIMLKSFGNGRRSITSVMMPLTETMFVKQAQMLEDYTTLPSVPVKYVNLAALGYIMTGKGQKNLNKLLDGAKQIVLPKVHAKIVDQFHHNTPVNDFNSEQVNAKLAELNLPAIEVNDLTAEGVISVLDMEAKSEVLKTNKVLDAIKGSVIKQSMPSKGISVWDFDDTLAKTKSNILYTKPGQTRIFHGGKIKSVKDIDGIVYFSEDQGQASAYAEGNQGAVNSFMLEESDIATEDAVFEVINELGIEPKNDWAVDESMLYELIDPRFEQAFSRKDRERLIAALNKKGIKAARFTDTNISKGKNEGREVDNIVVFNKKAVKVQNKLNAAEFAAQSDQMAEEGVSFDFSEFSKVVEGSKGPLFDEAVARNEKFGNDHVYILTARPENSARAIHTFLKGIGLDVKIENITGLQDSNPRAKADWVMGKVSEGYNDFYFADDHIGNVQAVQDILENVDVKSKVVQAGGMKQSKINATINEMIERTSGIEGIAGRNVLDDEAKTLGRAKDAKLLRSPRLFVPPSAEDFLGLLYNFAGKGKKGTQDLDFIHETFIKPYVDGVNVLDITNTKITIAFKELQANHKEVVDKLYSKVPGMMYTYDQAIRFYLYQNAGYGDMLAGKTSTKNGMQLQKAVLTDKKIKAYADALSLASGQKEGYLEPEPDVWLDQSIANDFKRLVTDAHRKQALAQWIENVDVAFTTENLNKIQLAYGNKFRQNLEGAIARMKSGTSLRKTGGRNDWSNNLTDWFNGAIAPVMFLNFKSASLQLLSTFNFINMTDNNPAKFAAAIANVPVFVKDFVTIFNSPKLLQRRSGLRLSIETAQIANMGGAKGPWGVFQKLLINAGFAPTKYADSIAIATGGAAFYRNRVNSLLKQTNPDTGKNYTKEQAEAQAWSDFSETSDKAQQSSDQLLTSAEQAGNLGRLVLAFANTPIQYSRLMKKAAIDLKNQRGDWKTNVSKIMYYGIVQNFWFSALQNMIEYGVGLFDDEDEDNELEKAVYDEAYKAAREFRRNTTTPKNSEAAAKEKAEDAVMKYRRDVNLRKQGKSNRVADSMTNSILRGLGVRGAIIAATKDLLLTYLRQADNRRDIKKMKFEGEKKLITMYQEVLDNGGSIEDAEAAQLYLREKINSMDPGDPWKDKSELLLAVLSISPPTQTKARDILSAVNNERWNADVIANKKWSYDSPRWKTVGLAFKTAVNLPAHWIPKKIEIGKQIAVGEGNAAEKFFMAAGWSPYDFDLKDEEFEKIKADAKAAKKEEDYEMSVVARDVKKLRKAAKDSKLSAGEKKKIAIEQKAKRSAAGKKGAATRAANKKARNIALYEEAQRLAKLKRKK